MPKPSLTVVQILPELNSGGVERGTVDFARYLVKSGHRSVVISAGGRLVSQLTAEGSQHIEYPVHKKSLISYFRVKGLKIILEEIAPDIIHVRSRIPAWMTWLSVRGQVNRPCLASTFHGMYSVNRYSEIMGCGDTVIAISQCVDDYIRSNYPRIDQDKISIVHRGVDTEEFNRGFAPSVSWRQRFFEQNPQLKGRRLLLMPGRLSSWKGQREFIQLIEALKSSDQAVGSEVHGVVVGDITPGKEGYRQELLDQVSATDLEGQVTFLGHRSDMKEIYSISDIAFNLSQKPEPFGRTVIEALAMGLPVIAWNEGGPAEVLADCFPKGLVEKDDMSALADKALELLSSEQDVKLAPQFTQDYQASATVDCYYRALEKRAATFSQK